MDGFFEKYNSYDFFNMIIIGLIFLGSIRLFGVNVFGIISQSFSLDYTNTSEAVFLGAILLVGCYVAGSCMQELGTWLERHIFKTKKKLLSNLLNDVAIVGNEAKLRVYQQFAKELLFGKGISCIENRFTTEQCEYFFAHCVYYIQVHNLHGKTERMRDHQGLSALLMSCFGCLFLIASGYVICLSKTESNISKQLMVSYLFGILAVAFYFRMKRTLRDRIRMVLGIYEASRSEK